MLTILHNAVCAAVVSLGFGALFNFPLRLLGFCALMGAIGNAVRTWIIIEGGSLEMGAFGGAVALSLIAVKISSRWQLSGAALSVSGCIPMVPGSFAAKAILGFVELTNPSTAPAYDPELATQTLVNLVHAIGIVLALGLGAALVSVLFPRPLRMERG